MPPRKRSSKRQTRLSFPLLPSSSPSARKYPGELQSRLANEPFETPSRSRKSMEQAEPKTPAQAGGEGSSDPILLDSSQDTDLVPDMPSSAQTIQVVIQAETSLPTPVASSQQKEQDIGQDGDLAIVDSPITVADVTSAPKTPVQNRDLDASGFDDDMTPILTTAIKTHGLEAAGDDENMTPAPTTPVKIYGHGAASHDEDAIVTSDEDVIVSRVRSRRAMATMDSDSDEEPDVVDPIRRSTRGRDVQQSSPVQRLKDVQIKSSPGRQTRSAAKQARKEILRSHKKTLTPRRDRSVQNPVSSDIAEAESSDDEDLTVRGDRPKPKRVHQLGQLSSDEERVFVDDDTEEFEDTGTSPTKRRKITPRKHQSVSPEKRGSSSSRRHSRRNSRQEKEDLEEDLADLEDTAVKETRTRRPSANVKNQARNEALKKLKRIQRERAGEDVSEDDVDIDGDELGDGDRDEDPENESVSEPEAYLGNLDEYEPDFLDDTAEGAWEHYALPIEYSDIRSKPPKELFKHVVKWLVHNKLNPAFDRHGEVYRLAFDKLNNEAEGLAGQGTSAAWGPHPNGIKFTKALKARPEIRIEHYDNRVLRKDCDACNRSNHPASFEMSFDGPLYNKNTLEPEEEDTSIGEDVSFEEDVPGPEATFYVGSKCKANAEKVHNLTHWRYHVNDWIVDWLKSAGELDDDEVVERSKWSKKKLEKLANKIVDDMEETRVIEELYKHLRLSIKEARTQQPGRFTNDY